jgi:hypothetical protein
VPVHWPITVCDVCFVLARLHGWAQRILAGCAAAAVATLITKVVAVAVAAALLQVGLATPLVARPRAACTYKWGKTCNFCLSCPSMLLVCSVHFMWGSRLGGLLQPQSSSAVLLLLLPHQYTVSKAA